MTHRSTTVAPDQRGHRLNRRQAVLRTGAGVAGIAAAGVARHAAAQEATPEASAPPALTEHGTVTSERAAQAAERVGTYAQELLEQTGVPGLAVAVVYNDEVLLAEGFGVREVGTDAAVDAETVFQLASLSKSIAATVVAGVVSDGTVRWDSPLSDIAPGFALAEAWPTQAVTVADLFAHRSGLADHAGDVLEDLGYPQSDIIHRLRYLEPEYSFRAGYAYTNYGLTTGAEAVASAAGVPWADLSQQRLYDPLGMDHTSSRFADYMDQPDRAIPHVPDGDSWRVTPQQRDPDPQSPAGGVSSNVNDLARWVRLLFGAGSFEGEELIAASALAPVHTPQIVRGPVADPATQQAPFYGLGTNIAYTQAGTPQWSHSGAFSLGAGTAYYLLPASKFGVVALTNAAPIGMAEALCLDIMDVAQWGEVSRDWLSLVTPSFAALAAPQYGAGTDWASPPNPATPALAFDAYAGTYENDFYGEVSISTSGDGLTLSIGPQPREFELTHYDRDTFSWQPTGENALLRSGLTFTIGPDGIAISFDDQYLEWGGAGTLHRSAAVTE